MRNTNTMLTESNRFPLIFQHRILDHQPQTLHTQHKQLRTQRIPLSQASLHRYLLRQSPLLLQPLNRRRPLFCRRSVPSFFSLHCSSYKKSKLVPEEEEEEVEEEDDDDDDEDAEAEEVVDEEEEEEEKEEKEDIMDDIDLYADGEDEEEEEEAKETEDDSSVLSPSGGDELEGRTEVYRYDESFYNSSDWSD